jgi:mRNA-degrading endonuclease toxin of MazEF toxin-antitoxin module
VVNGVPQQGDIIKLNLNPRMGHEQRGFRPVIVLRDTSFGFCGKEKNE